MNGLSLEWLLDRYFANSSHLIKAYIQFTLTKRAERAKCELSVPSSCGFPLTALQRLQKTQLPSARPGASPPGAVSPAAEPRTCSEPAHLTTEWWSDAGSLLHQAPLLALRTSPAAAGTAADSPAALSLLN